MARDFKVNNFDLLRILAATQVVIAHTTAHLDLPKLPLWKLVEAFPGVPIFFAISGFLISASFERNSSLRTYGRNRLLRIVPGLWCVVLLTIPVAWAFGFSFLHVRALAWLAAQLVALVYTPGFLKPFGFGSYNGALWTIPIELQFYVVLPVFYGLTRRAKDRTTWFVAFWVVFTAIGWMYARWSAPLAEDVVEPIGHKLFRYSFVPHIYMFLTGVLLQRWNAHQSRWIGGKGLFWLAGYLAVHLMLPEGAWSFVVSSLLMAVTVISLAYTGEGVAERLLRGNDISYGVYIYHGLILNVLVELGVMRHGGLLALVLVATYVVGFASWRLVERPFLKRKKAAMHAVGSPAH